MSEIVSRFFTFDKLIATILIKVFYWIGVVFIAIGVLVGIFGGFGKGVLSGLGMIIAAPVGGVIALIFWRFLCEIYIVVFGMYDRLGKIQEAVGGGAAKDAGPTTDAP